MTRPNTHPEPGHESAEPVPNPQDYGDDDGPVGLACIGVIALCVVIGGIFFAVRMIG